MKRFRIHNVRSVLSRILGSVQFAVDIYPRKSAYQPLPWLSINTARRSVGSIERWEAIKGALEEAGVTDAVDIGCNIGFFSIHLAKLGIETVGIEQNPRFFRTALHAKQRSDCRNLSLQCGEVSPSTVRLLPKVDAFLCLSVWHHWVKRWKLEGATDLTHEVWLRTGRVLFFETGQTEMPEEYGLPAMDPSPRAWLEEYLRSVTGPSSRIEYLGDFAAFAPSNRDQNSVHRSLFAVWRAFA